MSVESKVKELLERVSVKTSLEEGAGPMVPTSGKDSTIKPANAGDSGNPKQGDSKEASFETRDGESREANQGAAVSGGISKNDIQMKAGVGAAPNFTTVKDLSQIPQNTGIHEDEEIADDAEVIAEDEIEEDSDVVTEDSVIDPIDLSPIFGDTELSEEFRQKATSIFEAAVIARVNNEMEKVAESLEEKYAAEFIEYKESIVEKVDAYLNYVVENYVEENKLAIENGLRTEIAEDFMTGLKALFKEHYIEVPEEKYDVIGELQAKVTELEESLNSQVEKNVNLTSESTALKRNLIIKEMAKDLADTEVNKLTRLLEGVDFENEEIYKEKVSVIKENYFPSEAVVKEAAKQALTEETGTQATFTESNNVVSAYAQALTRTIKRT
jgi:regulator of replication initiation timing